MGTINDLIAEYGEEELMDCDSVMPGICTNPGCGNMVDVEPDCHGGWCEDCQTPSVSSYLELLLEV